MAVLVVSLAVGAGSAVASKGVVSVFGVSGSGDGQFANAGAMAVNVSSGDVYVVDQFDSRVEQFDASGAFVRAWGFGVADGDPSFETCTSNCQAGQPGAGDGQFDFPQGIAIDQSDGSVYVVDANNNRVEQFDASGAFVSQFGGVGIGDGEFSGPQGIAVDPSDGSVYIVDSGNNRVEKFDNAGIFQSQFGGEGSGDGQFEGPTRIAVDSSGQVYVLDVGNGRVERFTNTGVFDEVFDSADVNGGTGPVEIAIGPGNDHLYVVQYAPDFSEQRVFEIDGSGLLVDTHGAGSTTSNASGLALSASAQKIYLADGFNARVFVFDDVTPPSASMDPAGNVTSTSASISGRVNPNGPPAVGWHFETSTDEANWTPVATDQDAGSGTSDVPVSASLSGLVPNTQYFVRVAAGRPFNLPIFSADISFTTPAIAPDVITKPAQDVATTHATFLATLNAHHSATTFFFEYGPTTNYGTNIPPTQDADGGNRPDTTSEIQRIDNLQPGTTYHYRIVATDSVGTVHGQDQTFTTTAPPSASTPREGIPGTGFLPDERGWEQVSPTVKHGNDVLAVSARTRAASIETSAEPMAVTFSSLGGFADVQGTGVGNDYMSIRTAQSGTNGWSTHAITPKQSSLTFLGVLRGFESSWEDALSPDLSHGLYRARSPLGDAPNVADVVNLYLRDDLRIPGPGSYRLLSDCPFCGSPLPPIQDTPQVPRMAAASADFSHVIFESVYPLTPDATANGFDSPNLYESVNGTLRLAGVLPDSACGSPPCVPAISLAGRGTGSGNVHSLQSTPHTISADGSRIFFTDPITGSAAQGTGTLYMRVNGTSTVQVSASEKTAPDTPQPAQYQDATPDGSRVFFTSSEQLTNAPTNSTGDLYMYDVNAPAGHHLTLLSVDHEPADPPGGVAGVIGASSDGHYAYFIAVGQMVADEPLLKDRRGIYEWHDGVISYVGELADPSDKDANVLPSFWGLGPSSARVTPDGRHMLFVSSAGAGLTGYVQNGHTELYLYSADSHELQCISCNPSGAPATADAVVSALAGKGAAATTSYVNHPLSDDGSRVFFTTAEALVPSDANGKSDAYEYDVASGTLHLLSGGTDPSGSYFMDASPSGSDAFLVTHQHLTGWDNDQNYDLYDARTRGGFANPQPAAPECTDQSCQGQPPSSPSIAATGSATAVGGGNVEGLPSKTKPKPVRCRRGFVRKRVKGRVRCVKQPKKRHVKRAKRAHAQKRVAR